ncbi:hypothetical protein M3Y94_00739600 [Aphelenchoides besseyi]|nr:hypothetical protein M3Y94_00739600 [Aphelenchoides besseyi]
MRLSFFFFWISSSAQYVPAPPFIVANPSTRSSLILRTNGIITATKGSKSKYVFGREFMSRTNRTDFQLTPTKGSKLSDGIEIVVKILAQYQDCEFTLQFEQTKILFQRHNESNFVTLDEKQLDTQRAFVFSLNILPSSALYVAAGRQYYYNLTKKFTFFDRFVHKLPVRFGFDVKMPATSVVVIFKFSEIVELTIPSRSKQKAEEKTDDLVNGIVLALLIGIVPLVIGLLVIYHYTRIRTRTLPITILAIDEQTPQS